MPDQAFSHRADNRVLGQFQYKAAAKDLWAGLKLWRIWISLSWQEFSSMYRRSIFGIMWVVLSFAGFIFVKLIIFSNLLDTPDAMRYNVFLVTGLYVWFYLVSMVNGAPTSFTSAQGWIQSEPLPLSLYIYKHIMRELYNFFLTFCVLVAAYIYLGHPFSTKFFYAAPAVIFYILNAVWVKIFLGIIGARFRDIIHLVNAVILPMMFLTPIFWLPEQMAGLMKYLWWNPLFHYIEIFRKPFVDGVFPTLSWIFVLILFGVGNVLAFIVFARFRQRIVFWF